MHNFKKHKASQKSTAKRRHTDAGEHALSILIAKNEMDSLSTFSDNRPPHRSPELQTAYDSNPHAGIFKRIFRSKSLKKNTNVILSSRSNSTILKDSLPLLRSDSNNYVSVQDSIIYLVFQNSIREVSLPSVLTFDWITSSFKSTFNMNFSTDFESSFNFNIKHSNADSFSVSQSLLL
ncbi:hypothetical protein LOD99_5215 [Oopsacas minuta]|uniref:Uncharacterized protein n=1 Tax=Oopsacas minuta TaxID=111878 RepID=A0AAV7JR86_9METZ|nr:hypothetical protein LOD99_5215 [Oopsacas minuta]